MEMKSLKLATALLYLCVLPAFSQDADRHGHDHDHNHKHPSAKDSHHHEEKSNLMEQLGFGLVTAEDHLISGHLVTAIPASAIFFEKGKSFVITRDDKNPEKFNRWEVQLGKNSGRMVEAKAGVFPGDQLIVKERELVTIEPALKKAGLLTAGPEKSPFVAPVGTGAPPAQSVAPASSAPTASSVPTVPSAKPIAVFGVQIGAFSKVGNANRIAEKLRPQYGRTDVLVSESNGQSLYRVRVGEYASKNSANSAKETLKAAGFPESFVVAIK